MSLMSLVIFSCAITADPCFPDHADVYAEPLTPAACRSLPAIMVVASWAREHPDRRMIRWACVDQLDVGREIDRILGQEA